MAPVRHSSNSRDGVTPRDEKPTHPPRLLRDACPYCHSAHLSRAEYVACRVANTEGGA